MSHYTLVQLRVGEVRSVEVRSTRVAGITTSSSYVPREIVQPRAGHPRDVMVKALTRLEEHTDLQAIEHLDFDPAIPCECRPDDGFDPCDREADLIVRDWPCSTCGLTDGPWPCASQCWTELGSVPLSVGCDCGAEYDRDDILWIARRLR